MKNKELIGKEFITKHSGKCRIISLSTRKEIIVEFEDGYRTTCTLYNLRRGTVFNPFHPTVYGVGYIGEGIYKSKTEGKIHPFYNAWRGALRRSYDVLWHIKQPQYRGCSVDSRWHNYQKFCEWSSNEVFREGYVLDKDLLVHGNKVYGPDTCIYLPNELNCIISERHHRGDLPVGVSRLNDRYKSKVFVASCQRDGRPYNLGHFKTAEEAFNTYKKIKEEYVKERAEFWKNSISKKAYAALIAWEVIR